jgi:hypothetical protein
LVALDQGIALGEIVGSIVAVGYALFQHSLDPLDVDAVVAAYETTPRLTRVDAPQMARRACGILADGLSLEAATAIKQVLDARGQGVDIAPDEWLVLPRVYACRKAAAEPRALVFYDVYGRPAPVPWQEVGLVAAGCYGVGKTVKVQDADYTVTTDGYVIFIDAEYELQESDTLVLEVLVPGQQVRYEITSDKFDYSYLGERRRDNSTQNFAMLLHDVAVRSTRATINRGAEKMLADPKRGYRYQNKKLFERELAWLRFRAHTASATPDELT